MWKPGRPSAKLNEGSRLLAGPLGSFLPDLLAPLGIVVWIGYAFTPKPVNTDQLLSLMRVWLFR
jgi:hypothetical protein